MTYPQMSAKGQKRTKQRIFEFVRLVPKADVFYLMLAPDHIARRVGLASKIVICGLLP